FGAGVASLKCLPVCFSVISGVGELNVDRTNQRTERECVFSPDLTDRPYPDCPYLLLDVRDRDHFDCCHIISSHSFPIALLSRTMNPYTKDVLEYKNASGKIIIVYDEDERIATQSATMMCERGFENVYMLSGGKVSSLLPFDINVILNKDIVSCHIYISTLCWWL
ncbi:centrosomal protein of 41 kDa-like, partial [Notothenia coriiceps]|uniref:Centrosomal protein of 41 kDa-like n=1 Tax=Notothenia coriiceps TaxID=8208 RepID=A0A6I9Q0A3_9TELE